MSKKQEKAKQVAERLAKRAARATKPDSSITNPVAYLVSGTNTRHYRKVMVIRLMENGVMARARFECGVERVVNTDALFPNLDTLLAVFERRKQIVTAIHNLHIENQHLFKTVTRWSPVTGKGGSLWDYSWRDGLLHIHHRGPR